MKRSTYILILVLAIIQSCKNKEERVTTSTFANGDIKQEKVYPKGQNDSLNYDLIQYNSNGSIEMEGEFKNGKEQGVFTWFYPNGNKKWIETYDAGISIDTVFCFYESGKLKRKCLPPINLIRQANEYYETGELKIESFINNRQYIDSSWTGFFRNGKIKESGKVKKGEKEGIWKYYDNQGSVLDSSDQTGMSKVAFDFEDEELKYKNE